MKYDFSQVDDHRLEPVFGQLRPGRADQRDRVQTADRFGDDDERG